MRPTPPSTTSASASTSWSPRVRGARPRSTCGRATTATWAWRGTAPSPRWWSVASHAGGGWAAGSAADCDLCGGRGILAAACDAALDALRERFAVVGAEGAGSPTEINLRESDYVNMGLARHGSVPTVVVGDIDRGGVFAAMHGTVALLEAADQALVAGFIVNKFRGDATLLAPGLAQLEELTGRRVHGTLPWDPGLWLDSEDALDLDRKS